MAIRIRQATDADARDATRTLRRSIRALCVADHRNDPAEIDSWLANKTEMSWQAWVAREDAIVLVAERDQTLVGVGMATLGGEIVLNYVDPDARFCGVSKAILSGLENALRSHGARRCRVESTITARPFYESCGFRPESDRASALYKHL